MRAATALQSAILSLAICAGFAAAALAEDAPAPDPAKDIQACLDETGDFVTHGTSFTYVIGLENKCAKRLKCTIDAYITGAKGPVSVHTVMVLDAKSKKTYPAKVKTSGGTAQVSRDCKVF
jgi:uncharacterized protein YaaQ